MRIEFEQADYGLFVDDICKMLRQAFLPCNGIMSDGLTVDCTLFTVNVGKEVTFNFLDGSPSLKFPLEAFMVWCSDCERFELYLSNLYSLPELSQHSVIQKWLDAGRALLAQMKKDALRESVTDILSMIGLDTSNLRIIPITTQTELSELSKYL